MSVLSSFRRRLIVWLGGETTERPDVIPPASSKPIGPTQIDPASRPVDGTVAAIESAPHDGPIFDPDQPADAPFVDASDDSGPYPNDRRLKHRRSARAGTRVLLVDDSPTIVALLRKLLRQNGYETQEAGDAEIGIQLARDTQPDIIFLDIVLPGMNGFAALRALRRDPLTKTIPIIMISGNAAATEQFYVQRIGADDFMKKPFSRTEVFSRIERLLDTACVPRRAAERDPTPDKQAPDKQVLDKLTSPLDTPAA